MFGLLKRSSASTMYANHNICSFETMLRKTIFGFMQILKNNTVIYTLYQAWIVRFKFGIADNDNDNENEISLFRHK